MCSGCGRGAPSVITAACSSHAIPWWPGIQNRAVLPAGLLSMLLGSAVSAELFWIALRSDWPPDGWVSFCYLRILAKGPTGHDEYEIIQNTGKGFLIGIVSGQKLSFRQGNSMPTHLPSSCTRAEELYCPRFVWLSTFAGLHANLLYAAEFP